MSAAIHISDNEIWAEQIAAEAFGLYKETVKVGNPITLEMALILMEPDLPFSVLEDAHFRLIQKTIRWSMGRIY